MHYGCTFMLAGESSLIYTQSASFPSKAEIKSLPHQCELPVNIRMEIHKLVAKIWKEKNRFDHLKGARISLSDTRKGWITWPQQISSQTLSCPGTWILSFQQAWGCDPDLQWRILPLLTTQRHPAKRTRGDWHLVHRPRHASGRSNMFF